jgi:hypothetical protein
MAPISGKCFRCGAKCSGQYRCFGCKHFICDGCDLHRVAGEHDVWDHITCKPCAEMAKRPMSREFQAALVERGLS